jgi:hypothetical protein
VSDNPRVEEISKHPFSSSISYDANMIFEDTRRLDMLLYVSYKPCSIKGRMSSGNTKDTLSIEKGY